ncbi:MAG: hypothetical protein P8Y66_00635 [Nitrospirota bacterium]
MIAEQYRSTLDRLLEDYCLFLVELTFVENVYDWCREKGVEEPDPGTPLKLVVDEEKGCRVVVNREIDEKVLHDRMKALEVRSALLNVAHNKTEDLDTDKKKLVYLFLKEIAARRPELESDDILEDNWVFGEMKEHGFFDE